MHVGKYVGHMEHLGYRINGKNSIYSLATWLVYFSGINDQSRKIHMYHNTWTIHGSHGKEFCLANFRIIPLHLNLCLGILGVEYLILFTTIFLGDRSPEMHPGISPGLRVQLHPDWWGVYSWHPDVVFSLLKLCFVPFFFSALILGNKWIGRTKQESKLQWSQKKSFMTSWFFFSAPVVFEAWIIDTTKQVIIHLREKIQH